VRVHVRARACVRVRVCVRARARARVPVCVCVHAYSWVRWLGALGGSVARERAGSVIWAFIFADNLQLQISVNWSLKCSQKISLDFLLSFISFWK
jgi:hypothetical protein